MIIGIPGKPLLHFELRLGIPNDDISIYRINLGKKKKSFRTSKLSKFNKVLGQIILGINCQHLLGACHALQVKKCYFCKVKVKVEGSKVGAARATVTPTQSMFFPLEAKLTKNTETTRRVASVLICTIQCAT